MAPHAGFDTDQIKEKARKDLLYLLEGVSKDCLAHMRSARQGKRKARHPLTCPSTGSREEEPGD